MKVDYKGTKKVDGVLMCKCGKNLASAPHVCAFDAEVYGGHKWCVCCDECTKECYQET